MIQIDWDKIPKEYNWVAVDENRNVYCYRNMPYVGKNKHNNTRWVGRACKYIGVYNISDIDWKNSLTQRPVSISNLEPLIQQYFDENLIGKFSDKDGEFIKEIIKDFVKHYYTLI